LNAAAKEAAEPLCMRPYTSQSLSGYLKNAAIYDVDEIVRLPSHWSKTILRLSYYSAMFQSHIALWWWWRARPTMISSRRDAMILAVLLAAIAIISLCALLITLTIYALPFYIGLAVAILVHSNGSGLIPAAMAAIGAAIATLVILQILIATVRSPVLRAGIGVVFAAPAAFAAYHAAHGIMAAMQSTGAWPSAIAGISAAVVGIGVWLQIGTWARMRGAG
jgi:hypothetical protein